jgi:hypothetical protein
VKLRLGSLFRERDCIRSDCDRIRYYTRTVAGEALGPLGKKLWCDCICTRKRREALGSLGKKLWCDRHRTRTAELKPSARSRPLTGISSLPAVARIVARSATRERACALHPPGTAAWTCHERDLRGRCHRRDLRGRCHRRHSRGRLHRRGLRGRCHEHDSRRPRNIATTTEMVGQRLHRRQYHVVRVRTVNNAH